MNIYYTLLIHQWTLGCRYEHGCTNISSPCFQSLGYVSNNWAVLSISMPCSFPRWWKNLLAGDARDTGLIPSLQEDSLELLLFCHSVVCQSLQPTWTAAHWVSLSFTISRSLLKLTSIESVMPSNRLILCHPLLLLPSIFPSIRVFSNESVLPIRWPKYWSFSLSISPSNEYSGLISFRTD